MQFYDDDRGSKALRVPELVKALVAAFHPGPQNGVKILRLVSKDLKEESRQFISACTLRLDLGNSVPPDLLDAIGLLKSARLSSLQVTIVVADDGQKHSRKIMHRITLQIQQFVDGMGISLHSVTYIKLHIELVSSHTRPARPHMNLPPHLILKLRHASTAAQHVLTVLATSCPGMQRLEVRCPHLNLIPYHSFEQLHTLTLSRCTFEFYQNKYLAWPISELHPLLGRLTHLKVSSSSVRALGLVTTWLPCCVCLTSLDYDNCPYTADMWATLPTGLVELRCVVPRGLTTFPEYNAIPATLARHVFAEWRGLEGWSREFFKLLAAAPQIKEFVLQQKIPAPGDRSHGASNSLSVVCSRISTPSSLSALNMLHDRLATGMKVTTQHWAAPGNIDQPRLSSPGFQLVIQYGKRTNRLYFPEQLATLQPWPLFTDLLLECASDTELNFLQQMFPNLSSLALEGLQSLQQLAALKMCTSLCHLDLGMHDGICPRDLAAMVSSFVSLRSFNPGTFAVSERLNIDHTLLITQLLSESNPGLVVLANEIPSLHTSHFMCLDEDGSD